MAVDLPLGLRERKNRRTQLAIVRAAAELTIEGGYAHATIPRIAERADVSPRTVSTWFPTKDDILFGGTSHHAELAVKHLEEGPGDVVDRIEAWFAEERTREPPDPEIARLRFQAVDHDPALRARDLYGYEAIADAVAAAVARDTGASDADPGPQIFAGATTSLLRALRARSFTEVREDLTPEVHDGLAVLRRVLGALAADTR